MGIESPAPYESALNTGLTLLKMFQDFMLRINDDFETVSHGVNGFS